jgi:hypothetical protein
MHLVLVYYKGRIHRSLVLFIIPPNAPIFLLCVYRLVSVVIHMTSVKETSHNLSIYDVYLIYLSVYLSVFLSFCLSVDLYPSIHRYISISIYLSICLSIRPSCLSVWSICISDLCVSISTSIHPSIHIYLCLSEIHSIHPSFYHTLYLGSQ